MINDNQFYNTILINLIQVLYSFLKKKKTLIFCRRKILQNFNKMIKYQLIRTLLRD